jgi:hypothetical protein
MKTKLFAGFLGTVGTGRVGYTFASHLCSFYFEPRYMSGLSEWRISPVEKYCNLGQFFNCTKMVKMWLGQHFGRFCRA